MSRRALVVGASGQVGSQLVLALGESSLPAGRAPQSENWLHVDLAEIAHNPTLAHEIVNDRDFSAIYCVGGATDVERCESEREWAMNVNCHGPVALAKAALHIPFIYFSTEYVFDGVDGPYSEESTPSPISVYGLSKLLAEQEILDLHPRALIVRTTVVYGSDPREKNFLYSLNRQLSSGKTMRVPIDQISTPTCNLDLASATIELVCTGATGIFHVCGPEMLSRYDFAVKAANIMGLDASLIAGVRTAELNQKAPRPLRAGLHIEKLKTSLPSIVMRCTRDAVTEWKNALQGAHA
jgi:dTDP-4-dehydrorhamnose reductase